MARGRFISKEISLDEKVDALSDDTCRLLFTWLIPHLDCEGRMHGDATTVKSIVFPRRKISAQRLEKYLKELEKDELILRYSVNGNQYLWMKNFEKHQIGLRKNQEAQSQIPPFTTDLQRGKNVITPAQVKDKDKDQVKVKEEDKETPLIPPVSLSLDQVIEAYEKNICLPGTIIDEETENQLKVAVQQFSAPWVIDAIREACLQNNKTLRYIHGILKTWDRERKSL